MRIIPPPRQFKPLAPAPVRSSGLSRFPPPRRLKAELPTKPFLPLAFSKPGAILIPLEVYMVNFPSRPNSRPFDPPVLAERGSVSRRQVIRPAGTAIVSRPQSGRWTLLRVADPRSASCAALHRLGGDSLFLSHPGAPAGRVAGIAPSPRS